MKNLITAGLILTTSLFAFTSKYLPNKIIAIHCDKVLYKKAFDVCYNYKHKTPNMVVYKLYGNLVNKNNYSRKSLRFRPDCEIPTFFLLYLIPTRKGPDCEIPIKYRSYSRDYSRTGYDRGHNAPNASFDYDKFIQKQTFLMSNIAPQKPNLNRRLWAKIEKFTRIQAMKNKKISVITGNCGSLGHIKNNVNIPAYWYKIIFKPNNQVIAFISKNSNNVGRDKAKQHLTTLKLIESVCGFQIKEIR